LPAVERYKLVASISGRCFAMRFAATLSLVLGHFSDVSGNADDVGSSS